MLQIFAIILISFIGINVYQDGNYALACFDFALVGLNVGLLIARIAIGRPF